MTDIRISNDYERKQLIKILEAKDFKRPFVVKITDVKEKRSLNQNSLFHQWCGVAAKHFKLEDKDGIKAAEQMKDVFKHLHLGYEDRVINNTVIQGQLKHTSKLDQGEMCHFMTKVDHWCIEHGLLLPKPENSQYMELLKEQEK